MADRTYVVNEIVGTSTESLNEAIKNGIRRASTTLRNVGWFEVARFEAVSWTVRSATTRWR